MSRRTIRNSRHWLLAAIACSLCALAPVATQASSRILDNDPDVSTLSQYGGIGLLDTRSARFMPDGYFSAAAYVGQPDIRSSLTFQALPWMEVTFRYTVDNAIKDAGNRSLHDRSFDVKFRLQEETESWPAIALGLQDFLGTGVYSGEYLVASKHFGDFDFSAGLGWGRLASRKTFTNPLSYIYSGFGRRPGAFQGQGGSVLLTSFFRGPDMGIFGGLEYRTPIRDLSFIVEYSSDAYIEESRDSGVDYSFPVNAGFNYRPWPGFDVGLSYMHGNTVSLHLDAFFDPGEDHSRDRVDPKPPVVARNPDEVEAIRRKSMMEQPARKHVPKTQFVDLTQPDSRRSSTEEQDAGANTPNSDQLSSAPKNVLMISETGDSSRVADAATAPPPKPVAGERFVDLTQSDTTAVAQNQTAAQSVKTSSPVLDEKPATSEVASNAPSPSNAPKTRFVDLTQDTQVADATSANTDSPSKPNVRTNVPTPADTAPARADAEEKPGIVFLISETGGIQKLRRPRAVSLTSRLTDEIAKPALGAKNADRVMLASNDDFMTVAQRAVAFEQAADTEQATAPPIAQTMASAVEAQNLEVDAIKVQGDVVRIIVTNNRYLRDAEAVARTARALSATAPPEIEYFQIVTAREDVPLTSVLLSRTQLDALANHSGAPVSLFQSAVLEPADPTLRDSIEKDYPSFDSDYIFPTLQQSFFDPDRPYAARLGVGTDFLLSVLPGLTVEGAADAVLYDTSKPRGGISNSVLPHVRSDVAEYQLKGKYGFSDLQTSYAFKIAPEIYARVAAGYLEDMFAGAGGEVLYRPWGKRWAIGVDVWAVQQRDFNRLFGLRDYRTVTGQATLYYKLPWHDVYAIVRAGRFLAGDYGANFEVVRKFSTGMEIGAWATFTNVSAARFGEGSFDKGIVIRIPLEWVAPFPSRNVYNLELRSIQRDGGQRLDGVQRLYDMTDPSDYGEIAEQWNSVFG
ncbi:MAG: YjbH domain-containing protein [Proteobacteria bacterium]|nr:YjbH domain-containing protein [Pseudomonadota bacterium]